MKIPDGTHKIHRIEPITTSNEKYAAYVKKRCVTISEEEIDDFNDPEIEILFIDGEAKGKAREPEVSGNITKRLVGWYQIHEVKEHEILFKDRSTNVHCYSPNTFETEYSEGDYVKLYGQVVKHVPTP